MHARLFIENELLRQQMKNFAVRRQRDSAGLIDGLANFFPPDFARAY